MSKKSRQYDLEEHISILDAQHDPVPLIHTYFNPPPEVSIIFPPPTEEDFSALQSGAEDADINVIVNRMLSGAHDEFNDRVAAGHYADLTVMPDYTDAQRSIAEANSAFELIPATIREEFDNSPAKFLAFIDKGDRNEFERLGLVPPQAPQTPEERDIPLAPPFPLAEQKE